MTILGDNRTRWVLLTPATNMNGGWVSSCVCTSDCERFTRTSCVQVSDNRYYSNSGSSSARDWHWDLTECDLPFMDSHRDLPSTSDQLTEWRCDVAICHVHLHHFSLYFVWRLYNNDWWIIISLLCLKLNVVMFTPSHTASDAQWDVISSLPVCSQYCVKIKLRVTG